MRQDCSSATVDELITRHSDLFKDELGTVKAYRAKLHVKLETIPKFCKARPVSFTIKSAIESELDQLQSNGIITKVLYSKWTAPIVPVPKKNGRFHICGYYTVTVNPTLDVDQYPLPKPEDLFTSLAGGKKLTTLDLSQAYQQIMFDAVSQKFATIHTHRGLYQNVRFTFGVASAPA